MLHKRHLVLCLTFWVQFKAQAASEGTHSQAINEKIFSYRVYLYNSKKCSNFASGIKNMLNSKN